MTKELTEPEILKIMSYDSYQALAMDVYERMVSSEKFKDPEKVLIALEVFELSKKQFLHLEANLIKVAPGVNDFGFTRMVITDDIDFSLDRLNEVKRQLSEK